MNLTIKQDLCWKGIKNIVKSNDKNCETYQLNKLPRTNCGKLPRTNFGKLPMKDSVLDSEPWKRVCSDAIETWSVSVTEHQKEKEKKRKSTAKL